jgi:hypothetical protein
LYLLALALVFVLRDFIGGGMLGAKAAILASPFFFYLAATAITTFSLNPVKWIITEVGVFLSHVWYGIQFMRGLCASKAPCEFIGKDHTTGH